METVRHDNFAKPNIERVLNQTAKEVWIRYSPRVYFT